jgi:hypothetical protein
MDTDFEDTYCTLCCDSLCEDCVRVPDDDNQIDLSDYCLPCYILEGYGELWEIEYMTTQGDIFKMRMDTPVNTCSFLIPKFAKQQGGTLYYKIANFHKVKDKDEILGYVNSHTGDGR